MALLERLGVNKDRAIEAQRIACLPPEELEAFCAERYEEKLKVRRAREKRIALADVGARFEPALRPPPSASRGRPPSRCI